MPSITIRVRGVGLDRIRVLSSLSEETVIMVVKNFNVRLITEERVERLHERERESTRRGETVRPSC